MKDILLDENGDLLIVDGDLVIGDAKQQSVETLILANKGEFKEFPLVGFGAINYVKSDVSEVEFKRDLKVQLEYIGFKNPEIDLSEGFENLKIKIQ
ncbi:oxidase [Tenacibaculum sp. SSH1-16]|uniref:oxidase n=1 Tax=Tenacibaculum sp. SSH1-16 TaxID=3136667 RepID=UPI0032C48F7F